MSQGMDYGQPGMDLVQSLIRLPQVVRLHQPNNKLYVTNLNLFRQSLLRLWEEKEIVTLSAHHGRVFVNNNRLTSRAMALAVEKLVEQMRTLGFMGLSFKPRELSDDDIIELVRLLTRAPQERDPGAWLTAQLEAMEGSWIVPLTEENIRAVTGEDGSDLGNDGNDVKGVASTEKADSVHQRRLAGKKRGAQSVEQAKKNYGMALGTMLSLERQLSEGRSVGLQRPKRIIQNMVETLVDDENLILGLSTIRDYDDYTCTHSVNVAILSMCVGLRLGLPKESLVTLGLSGLFHDLGKVDVPVSLIRKAGAFTPEEYAEVKKHSIYSVREIIKLKAKYDLKSRLLLPPFEHHLGLNFSGYPRTGRKAPISLYGRILSVADNYDALTSSRSYRPVPISPDKALEIMISQAGTVLDPYILKVFVNMLGVYPMGTVLVLDSGEVAMVAGTPAGSDQGRPIVRILNCLPGGEIAGRDYLDLGERDANGAFKKNILRCFHPADYGLDTSPLFN